MRLLLIDNYDSFVYNLAQAFGALEADPIVVRNDASVADLEAVQPDALVVSPGPGTPDDAGVSVDAIKSFAGRVPILGVCLGHQCIASAYGGHIDRAAVGPVHGKTSTITHSGVGCFSGVPSPIVATRYHSLAIEAQEVPDVLEVTATSDDGVVMGVRHKELPIEGVQFHPESVLSEEGPLLLENFLRSVRSTANV
ncbi:MAG: aminodeoxychorismate/anthranilate synthase component II [Actinomycetota bacterium]|nr:aminodeoxychorismate/anthranilate synthase component II [Actinomycetota bacterium]